MKTNPAITEVSASPHAAHTPGPWKVRVSHNGALRGYSIEHEDETLRSIVARNWEHELCEEHGNSLPNARLIASAPDLIVALAGCADALREAGKDFAQANRLAVRPNLYELHERAAREAIAKARG